MGPWGIAVLGGSVIVADRVTKSLAVRTLPSGGSRGGVLRLTVNDRLPLAAAASSRTLVGLWFAAILAGLGGLTLMSPGPGRSLASVGVAVALSGAASNLRDCVARRSVVDFIAIGWWPVFNLADAAIVAGGLIAALSLI